MYYCIGNEQQTGQGIEVKVQTEESNQVVGFCQFEWLKLPALPVFNVARTWLLPASLMSMVWS